MKLKLEAGIPVQHLNETLRSRGYEIVIGGGGFLLRQRDQQGRERELERRQQAARCTA